MSEDEVNVSEDKAVSGDEVTAPEEKEEESEGDGYYEDALVSDDVPVEEEEDVDADSFCALSFKMYYDQKESRKLGVSINNLRKSKGLVAYTYDNGLEEKACQRATEAAVYYSNTRPDGRDFSTIFDSNVNAKDRAKKEVLIREGNSAAEAFEKFLEERIYDGIAAGATQ